MDLVGGSTVTERSSSWSSSEDTSTSSHDVAPSDASTACEVNDTDGNYKRRRLRPISDPDLLKDSDAGDIDTEPPSGKRGCDLESDHGGGEPAADSDSNLVDFHSNAKYVRTLLESAPLPRLGELSVMSLCAGMLTEAMVFKNVAAASGVGHVSFHHKAIVEWKKKKLDMLIDVHGVEGCFFFRDVVDVAEALKNRSQLPDGRTKEFKTLSPESMKVDIIVSGYPCVDLSLLNPRRKSFHDETGQTSRAALAVREIAEILQPRLVIFENVPGVMGVSKHNPSPPVREQDAFFQRLGYTAGHQLLNAADYGLPQSRRRVYMWYMKTPNMDRIPQAIRNGLQRCNMDTIYRSSSENKPQCVAMRHPDSGGSSQQTPKWQTQLATMREQCGISVEETDMLMKELKLETAPLSFREATIVAFEVANLKRKGVNMLAKDAPFALIPVDQNPIRVNTTVCNGGESPRVLPCLTPHGRWWIPSQGRFLDLATMGKMQGFSVEELKEATGPFYDDAGFVQNCLGNGFASNVFAAVLVACLRHLS